MRVVMFSSPPETGSTTPPRRDQIGPCASAKDGCKIRIPRRIRSLFVGFVHCGRSDRVKARSFSRSHGLRHWKLYDGEANAPRDRLGKFPPAYGADL